MKVLDSFEKLFQERSILPEPVGLVPTMGFLHEGHLSLVKRAKAECERVVVSIYVNPTQFGEGEDFSTYPRDLDRDLDLLESAGADLVWIPRNAQMYPVGHQTWVEVEKITQVLEGGMRPGHFRGVTTIVAKLFNAVRPNKAYFGQKDAQQVAVIRQMTMDLSYPIEIVVCPIVREPDGLAMSSRNSYLSPTERQAAVILSKALKSAERAYLAGERDGEILKTIMLNELEQEPLANPQYVSCANRQSLLELDKVVDGALLSMAVFIGKTRLIDNIVLL